MNITHDGVLTISTGESATTSIWTRENTTWEALLDKLSKPVVTWETKAAYAELTGKLKTRAKDVGGYVGGSLQNGKRGKNDVLSRQLITLDLDGCTNLDATWGLFQMLFDCAACIHTTHSHTPEDPRARLIIPVKQDLKPKYYTAVSKYIAEQLGLSIVDPTTHEPNRLMFWPSVCSDAELEFVFEYNDAPWLDAEPYTVEAKKEELLAEVTKQDPTKIPGLVGRFNTAYDIHETINKFLSDVYESVGDDRYRLIGASSTAGLIVYDEGKYCYSHHAKDPIQGKLVHSYDLVKAHKFNWNDTTTQKWIVDNGVCESGAADSAILTLDKKGKPEVTISNMRRILNDDAEVSNAVAFDEMAGKLMVYGDFPWLGLMDRTTLTWTDTDDAGLREFFESKYGMVDRIKLQDAIALTANQNKFHPVRTFLNSTVWDGVARADTLLIDFLGAEDSPYVRAVTRKALLGAAARILAPGCKHDHVLVLVGPQGCRKSTTINKLGGKWYTDSLYTLSGKEAYEQVQGYWIIEMSEMAAFKKAEIEQMKQFISKQSDNFRAAYDRRTMDHPRQCAFFGSTNDEEFLTDYTGNRRFWPVNVHKVPDEKYAELNEEYVKQLWAEIVVAFKAGEKWHLDEKEEAKAVEVQEEHMQISPLEGAIKGFVETPVPRDWRDMRIDERRTLRALGADGFEVPRDRVCAAEVWVECLNGNLKDLTPQKTREINAVLKRMKGWVNKSVRINPDYGVQRGFVRE